jgi:hypothetical protein
MEVWRGVLFTPAPAPAWALLLPARRLLLLVLPSDLERVDTPSGGRIALFTPLLLLLLLAPTGCSKSGEKMFAYSLSGVQPS